MSAISPTAHSRSLWPQWRWAIIDASASRRFRKHLSRVIERARDRDTLHAAERLCRRDPQGRLVFDHQPPTLQPFGSLLEQLRGDFSTDQGAEMMESILHQCTIPYPTALEFFSMQRLGLESGWRGLRWHALLGGSMGEPARGGCVIL